MQTPSDNVLSPPHLPVGPVGSSRRGPEAASSPATRLDPLETNVSAKKQPPNLPAASHQYLYAAYPGEFDDWHPEDDPCQAFVHSGWAATRRRIDAAFDRTDQPRRRRTRFRECGSGAWVYQNESDPTDVRMKANWCHDRFCLVCGAQRAAHIAGRVKELLADTRPLFITLTLRHGTQSLTDLTDRLFRGFRLLRQTELWTSHVRGGVAFLEIKRASDGHRWHPHLHVLAIGGFMAKDTLSTLWRSITGDSFIVDIQRVASPAEGVSYVAKYASKPMDPGFTHAPDLLDEAIISLRGRRLVTTFGTWRGAKLNDDEPEGPDDEVLPVYYKPICTLAALLEGAKNGQKRELELLAHLGSRRPRPPTPADSG